MRRRLCMSALNLFVLTLIGRAGEGVVYLQLDKPKDGR